MTHNLQTVHMKKHNAVSASMTGDIWIIGDLRTPASFETSLNVLAGAEFAAMALSGKKVFVIVSSQSNLKGIDLNIPDATGSESNDGECLDYYDIQEKAVDLAIKYGADKVLVLYPEKLKQDFVTPGKGEGLENNNMKFAGPSTDEAVCLLSDAVNMKKPAICLFPLNERMREIGARCAFLCHSGMIADCIGFQHHENKEIAAVCPSYGGEVMATLGFTDPGKTGFMTVQPNAFQKKIVDIPADIPAWRVEKMEINLLKSAMVSGRRSDLRLVSRKKEPPGRQRLEKADKIVVGGAGVGNIDGFRKIRKLAAALGAEVGATRPPVLWHWTDDESLIGQTGKTVHPELLISVGTSGAVQYTAGITGAKQLIAVNKDPNAPIFRIAHTGIVADAAQFIPLLTDRIQKNTLRFLADAIQPTENRASGADFGSRLMDMRRSHNFEIETLAQKIGLAPELVEDLENNRTTPSVGLMIKLAEIFDVDAGAFLNEKERTSLSGKRVEEYIRRTDSYYYQSLTPGAENEHLRVFLITIESNKKHKPVSYRHEGEEFIYVMEGKLELTIGNKVHKLMQGEFIKFNSENPHQLKSVAREMTRCLVTLYTP